MNLTGDSFIVSVEGDRVGRLVGISVDPATDQVVELLARTTDELPSRQIAIPVQSVFDVVDVDVRLTLSTKNCRALPATSTGGHQMSNASSHATGRQVLAKLLLFGMLVTCLDGPVGPLRRILYDQYSYDVEELIIGSGQWLPHEVGVPAAWVREIHRDRIVLSSVKQELVGLPPAPEDR